MVIGVTDTLVFTQPWVSGFHSILGFVPISNAVKLPCQQILELCKKVKEKHVAGKVSHHPL